MKLNRILETSLYAEDLEAAEAFYTGMLGLEVHSRLAGRHVFFRVGAEMLLVFNPDRTEKEADSPHGCRGRGHVAWAVPAGEMEDWRRRLAEKRVPFKDHLWREGIHSLYFSDPAGNSLELAAPNLWDIS